MRNETFLASQYAFQPARFSRLAHCTRQQIALTIAGRYLEVEMMQFIVR